MATDSRPYWVRIGKQAEFLMHVYFPWSLIERIGVHATAVCDQALKDIEDAPHQPKVKIKANWYH